MQEGRLLHRLAGEVSGQDGSCEHTQTSITKSRLATIPCCPRTVTVPGRELCPCPPLKTALIDLPSTRFPFQMPAIALSQGWARLISVQVSHVGGRNPCTVCISCCLPECSLTETGLEAAWRLKPGFPAGGLTTVPGTHRVHRDFGSRELSLPSAFLQLLLLQQDQPSLFFSTHSLALISPQPSRFEVYTPLTPPSCVMLINYLSQILKENGSVNRKHCNNI